VKRSEIPDFVLNPTEEDGDLQKEQVPIYLLYSYKSTNTDWTQQKKTAIFRKSRYQFTCFTRTKVQILTEPNRRRRRSAERAGTNLLALLVQKYKYRHKRRCRVSCNSSRRPSYLIYLLYSYKSTNTDTKGAAEYRATAPDGRAEDGRGSTRATRGIS
jgi:hypothetical protein